MDAARTGRHRKRCWLAALLGVAVLVTAGCGGASKSSDTTKSATTAATSTPSTSTATASGGAGTPIKIGVLSDCQGAFGSFDNQDLAGVVAALSEYAGAKPKNPNKPRDGWTGG